MLKTPFLLIILTCLSGAQATVADNRQKQSSEEAGKTFSVEDLSQAEYISHTVECTVMELSTQYDSGVSESGFHCIEEPDHTAGTDGKVFELRALPPEFEQTYRSKFSSGRARLRASNFYRSQHEIIFTRDTTWSITDTGN